MMMMFTFFLQPPTRSPQKTRQGETGNGEKEETEIAVRNKQENASRPPPSQPKKSIVPSTVSRKVMLHIIRHLPNFGAEKCR